MGWAWFGSLRVMCSAVEGCLVEVRVGLVEVALVPYLAEIACCLVA